MIDKSFELKIMWSTDLIHSKFKGGEIEKIKQKQVVIGNYGNIYDFDRRQLRLCR